MGLRNVAATRRGRRGPRLNCMAGVPLSDTLRSDAAQLERLSPGALKNIWDVLQPCLAQTMTPALEQALSGFCTTHEIPEPALGHVIRALTTMLRGAASIGLPKDAFADDLATVWPNQGEAHEVFLARYSDVVALLQSDLLAQALTRHGNVLTGIDWRIDRVMGDNDAPHLGLPVAIVTLAYQRRDKRDDLTLQLTPAELKRAAAVLSALAEQTERLLAADGDEAASSAPESPAETEGTDGNA